MKVGGPQRAVAGSRAYSVERMSDSSSCGRRARLSQLDPQSHFVYGENVIHSRHKYLALSQTQAQGNKGWDFKKLKQSNALAH